MNFRASLRIAAYCAMMGCGTAAHATLDLTGQNYVTYGDANSYSLGISAFIYDAQFGGGTGPGNPFYVVSTPGAIKDLIVVATGAAGGPVNTNFAGMDDALATPNASGNNFFSGIWNSTLAAFTGFLNGENPLFFFNNNQINSGASTNQSLAAWGQISLTGAGKDPLYFDLTNNNNKYALVTEGGGGVLNGNPGLYGSAGLGPIAGTNLATDYVLAGGAICLTAGFVPVSCSNPAAFYSAINNNLGANQAAYAVDIPELNALLKNGGLVGYQDIHIDLRLGCDPLTVQGNCIGRDINNGFEQVFIGTSRTVIIDPQSVVPEPGSVALIGIALVGIAGFMRRRKTNQAVA